MNNTVKTILMVGFIGIVLALAIFITPKEEKREEKLLGIDYTIEGNESALSYESDNPIAAIYIKDYGSIVMELYPDIAPNTVNNFISLIRNGFYDHNTFHRLVEEKYFQGGDPTGTGNGGPGYSIKGEFSSNGFENNLSHEKWIVSMARATDFDTAGSQFFICLGDVTFLDGNYAAFGKVIDGFDIIEAIEQNEKVADLDSGKLRANLTLEKALIDLRGKEYPEPEIITE